MTLKGEKCDPATFNEASNIYDFILPLRVSNLLKAGNKELSEKEIDVKTYVSHVFV